MVSDVAPLGLVQAETGRLAAEARVAPQPTACGFTALVQAETGDTRVAPLACRFPLCASVTLAQAEAGFTEIAPLFRPKESNPFKLVQVGTGCAVAIAGTTPLDSESAVAETRPLPDPSLKGSVKLLNPVSLTFTKLLLG